MRLMEKARVLKRQREQARTESDESWIQRGAVRAANVVNQGLDLTGESELKAEDMTVLDYRGSTERNLYSCVVDGIEFAAGIFWHGNPGDGAILAVRTGRRTKPIWPPSGRSSNPSWNPPGYTQIHSLADLADLKPWVVETANETGRRLADPHPNGPTPADQISVSVTDNGEGGDSK